MLNDTIRRALTFRAARTPPASAGLAHFATERDGRPVRYHLRVEPDGAGLVVANAAAACRLSPSGVLIVRELLGGLPAGDVVRLVQRSFRGVGRAAAERDVARVRELLDRLAAPHHGGCPLVRLDGLGAAARRGPLAAPLGADWSVEGAAPSPARLRALWDAGVPHVVFVPEPGSSPEPLVAAVECAEDLGLVAGVRARASDLAAPGLLARLVDAGLDHLDLGWAGPEAGAHDSLFGDGDLARAAELVRTARESELFVSAVVPLTAPYAYDFDDEARSLAEAGIGAAAVWAVVADADAPVDGTLPRRALPQVAATVEHAADRRGLAITWCPPAERDPRLTLVEQVRRGPRAVGEACVRVERDGSVLAPSGPPAVAGRLGEQPWPEIWAHDAFVAWRVPAEGPPRCPTCPGLATCRDGCPADPATWARLAREERR